MTDLPAVGVDRGTGVLDQDALVTATGPDQAGAPAVDDPGARGRLTVRPRAVERVAEMAALGVPGSVAVVGSDAGRMFSRSVPRALATVTGSSASIRVQVAAAWPTPVADLLAGVQAAVRRDTVRLTGLTLGEIDVHLLRMTDPDDLGSWPTDGDDPAVGS